MADVSELAKLTPAELEKIQSVIKLFHLLGLSDEDISLLPQVLKNWRKVVDTINAHSNDLTALKRGLSNGQSKDSDASSDNGDTMRVLVGFDNMSENVKLGDMKGGRK